MATPQTPDFVGALTFQSAETPRSLESTGAIYADVDPVTGGFATWVGDSKQTLSVPIYNARAAAAMTLDENGFQLVERHALTPINFYDERAILSTYYPETAELLRTTLGAHKVFVFDHVVRNTGVSSRYAVKDGQKIGGPAMVVHCDYGMRGGPVRVANFSKPPMNEDAYRPLYGERPLISAEETEALKGRRFAIINLWRSFTDEPCVDMPLTFCDTQTTAKEDYATVEFRYATTTIETYLGGHSPQQKWYYFPALLKSEGILIKTYDSQGALFADFDYAPRRAGEPLVPATAVLHSAVKDPRLEGTEYRGRESIEVRAVVFY